MASLGGRGDAEPRSEESTLREVELEGRACADMQTGMLHKHTHTHTYAHTRMHTNTHTHKANL